MAAATAHEADSAAGNRARAAGIAVAQSARAGSGRITRGVLRHVDGAVGADNLPPSKARILLALTMSGETGMLERVFGEY